MQSKAKDKAFTLIELLVVIAIIAMLTALLAVAQQKVKIVSKNLRQKAAFHGGEISLELFQNDYGHYPDSALVEQGGTYVTGSQRVAEAFFGRDDRGFHPKTKWHPVKDIAAGAPYAPNGPYTIATIKERKLPYFERKHSGFYATSDLWGAGVTGTLRPIFNGGAPTTQTPVFTDVFTRNKLTIAGESVKVGTPILYFRADPTKKFRVDVSNTKVGVASNDDYATYDKWIYNFEDNLPLLELPWLRDPTVEPDGLDFQDGVRGHYKDPADAGKSNAQYFYELITQREDGNYLTPYNKSKFLLISAGWDGIFGTKDDLTNFDD